MGLLLGSTWSSVAADELFEHCQDKQLVAKVIMIMCDKNIRYYDHKGNKDRYQ